MNGPRLSWGNVMVSRSHGQVARSGSLCDRGLVVNDIDDETTIVEGNAIVEQILNHLMGDSLFAQVGRRWHADGWVLARVPRRALRLGRGRRMACPGFAVVAVAMPSADTELLALLEE
ncbi:hypothetical protein KCU81_g582, partial [Aureobasidium melanogenum]